MQYYSLAMFTNKTLTSSTTKAKYPPPPAPGIFHVSTSGIALYF